MNKPEFPKARIIREDFLPEQDPLRNYRIKKVISDDGVVWYQSQKKILWFWVNMKYQPTTSIEWANYFIFEDIKKHQENKEVKVEYLRPDIFLSKPKPPLKFKKTT